MEIPKTTINEPFIQFEFDKNGNFKLSTSKHFWSGKNHYFIKRGEIEGNSCKPEELSNYIKAFKIRKIKEVKNEILDLQKQLKFFNTFDENKL